MGKAKIEKGKRAERQFAKLIDGERVPLSGAAGGSFVGDVVGMGMRWECKVKRDGFKLLYAWLEGKDALALKADRRPWLVVLPLETFLEMQEKKKVCCGGCNHGGMEKKTAGNV